MLPQKHWVQDRIIEPRRTAPFGGVDHGSEGFVLAEVRKNNKVDRKLVWFKGHEAAATGIRGMGRTYYPANLVVLNHNGITIARIFEGGRLSRDRIVEYGQIIDREMVKDCAKLLDPRWTLVIVEDELQDKRILT